MGPRLSSSWPSAEVRTSLSSLSLAPGLGSPASFSPRTWDAALCPRGERGLRPSSHPACPPVLAKTWSEALLLLKVYFIRCNHPSCLGKGKKLNSPDKGAEILVWWFLVTSFWLTSEMVGGSPLHLCQPGLCLSEGSINFLPTLSASPNTFLSLHLIKVNKLFPWPQCWVKWFLGTQPGAALPILRTALETSLVESMPSLETQPLSADSVHRLHPQLVT